MGYKTGFCGIGACEGTRPKSASGKPMKVCTYVEKCTCKCHKKITEMYELAGVERVTQANPDYEPALNVDLTWLADISSSLVVASPVLAGYATGATAPEVNGDARTDAPRVYAPTATGGRARGQLEDQVYEVCKRYMLEPIPELMTPRFIGEQINKDNPPSVGAIGAVLDRWEKYGFAIVGRKPIRFMMITKAGMTLGLEKMRADFKLKQH